MLTRSLEQRTRADFKAAQADWEAEKMRLQQQVAAQRAQVEKVTISHDIMDGNLSSVKHDLKMARNRENGAVVGWLAWLSLQVLLLRSR